MRRRDFLKTMALAAGATAMGPLGWTRPGARALAAFGAEQLTGGKILVMVVFQGGNDGINTVIPYADDLYGSLRPTLQVPGSSVLPLDGAVGLHPALAPLMPLWDAGRLAVVQGVGYPDMNLSHFRGSDIIFSGSSSETVLDTGWLGRWLELTHPELLEGALAEPLALQQGFSAQLPLNGSAGSAGVVVNNPETFFEIVNATYAGVEGEPGTGSPGDEELAYVRGVDVASFAYAEVIEAAAEAGTLVAEYPDGNFGGQLATVARLISGGLGTSVYLTAFSGFDTHGAQASPHADLLDEFARAVAAFQQDLEAMGRSEEVTLVTVSEFGRRPRENGSLGTDHGTSAPWFVIGGGIAGGIHGSRPELDQLDPAGNLAVTTDYRSIYASLLGDWFGSDPATVESVLQGGFPALPLVKTPAARRMAVGPALTRLMSPVPNPARGPRTLRFDLARSARVNIEVFDVRGRRVQRVLDEVLPAGFHERVWDPGNLPAGVYLLSLDADGQRDTRKAAVH